MSVELIAARIIAPIIGSSVFTWTSVIGIILFGISIGNYFGGRLIDKNPSEKLLARLLILASLFIVFIPLLAKFAPLIVLWQISLIFKILIISSILFLAPAIFLGAIYPAALKLYIRQTENIGEKAGLLSALGALGSILGTFLTGFFFVGFIGSASSLYILSLILLISSQWFGKYFSKDFWLASIFISILIFAHYYFDFKKNNIIFETESNYYKIRIVDGKVKNTLARILFLDFDSHSAESLNNEKIGTYQEIASLFKAFKNKFENILVIGGGSYNLPKNFSNLYKSEITVVEIDSAVTDAAKKFFNLNSYPINTVNADGRLYLTTNEKTYDFIFGDAFNSFISIPWHLATQEANDLVKKRLNAGGIYALNFMSGLSGENGAWFESVAKTFSQTFPNYYAVYFSENGNLVQNIILIGVNSEEKIDENKIKEKIFKLAIESGGRINLNYKYKPKLPPNSLILRDDFAPAERLIAPLIGNYINPYSSWFYSLLN